MRDTAGEGLLRLGAAAEERLVLLLGFDEGFFEEVGVCVKSVMSSSVAFVMNVTYSRSWRSE